MGTKHRENPERTKASLKFTKFIIIFFNIFSNDVQRIKLHFFCLKLKIY